jgi:hypothetical protein
VSRAGSGADHLALDADEGVADLLGGLDLGLGERLARLAEVALGDGDLEVADLLDRLLDAVEELFGRFAGRVSTAALNRALEEIGALREPPRQGRRRLNVLYGAQYRTRPPRFRIVVNDRRLVTRDYAYFVENQLRARLALEGCPVIVDFQTRA